MKNIKSIFSKYIHKNKLVFGIRNAANKEDLQLIQKFMTAVVGILNKHAVAIAADSAVTVQGQNGRKIFNKANKVFTLSKHHPVGIMIYNSASFMSTPWEIIIKTYRKQLGDKSFNNLRDYVNDFLLFLKLRSYFSNDDTQDMYLHFFIDQVLSNIFEETLKVDNSINFNPTDTNKLIFIQNFKLKVDELYEIKSTITEFCDEFKDYKLKDFTQDSEAIFQNIFKTKFIDNSIILDKLLQNKIKEIIFYLLREKVDYFNYTGLIFTGFGEEEIYPQLIPLNISFTYKKRTRYYLDQNSEASISDQMDGAVRPFAQTDVISTILSGIDPSLNNTYLGNFEKILTDYNNEIIRVIGTSNPKLTAQISALPIPTIIAEYSKMNDEIKQKLYIGPLMNAVSNLDKEDLSEMAESLIYLTYLKRRITFAEESVGGPVDVAIISKGDGFVWIKRKHYFRPELNQHFFDNYFK